MRPLNPVDRLLLPLAAMLLLCGCSARCDYPDQPVFYLHDGPARTLIVPEPQEMRVTGGETFVWPENAVISAEDEAGRRAAEILAGELREYFGLNVSIGENGPVEFRVSPEAGNGRSEGYTLISTPEKITVAGHDAQGAVWGAMTLLQMTRKSPADMRLHVDSAEITDWPEIPRRSYFFELNANGEWGGQTTFHWLKRCIRRMNAYNKCNMVGLGEAGAGCFPLKKYPFLEWKNGLTAEQIGELVSEAKKYGVEPYPVIEIFGHAEGLFIKREPECGDLETVRLAGGNELFDFVELNEDGSCGNAVCLSNPATRRVAADVMESVTELFDHPKYVHIGMDEAHPVGTCPLCRGKDPAELFGEYLVWCNDELHKLGVERAVLWADMLFDRQRWSGIAAFSNVGKDINMFGARANFRHATHPALDMIPRDMVLVPYDYSGPSAPPLAYLKEKGFPMWTASWTGAEAAFKVGRRAAEFGMEGMIGTTWTFSYWRGMATLASAEAAWAPGKAIRDYDREARLHLDLLPPRPSEFSGTVGVPFELKGNVVRDDLLARTLADVRDDRPGTFPESLEIGRVTYRFGDTLLAVAGSESRQELPLPREAVLPVDDYAVGMAFLQGGLLDGILRFNRVAVMTVVYEDGTMVSENIVNGTNTHPVQYKAPDDICVRSGLGWTTDARLAEMCSPRYGRLRFQSWEWLNPNPGKKISRIVWEISPECEKEVFAVFASALIRKETE